MSEALAELSKSAFLLAVIVAVMRTVQYKPSWASAVRFVVIGAAFLLASVATAPPSVPNEAAHEHQRTQP